MVPICFNIQVYSEITRSQAKHLSTVTLVDGGILCVYLYLECFFLKDDNELVCSRGAVLMCK